jgi:hypothetical protein
VITICLLTYAPPGVTPDREHLENGVRLNPHGSGFAIGWSHLASMDAGLMITEFLARREMRPDLPALFHSRAATGDSPRTPENCHPFRTYHGKDRYSVMGHNGYLFAHEGQRSDSAIFAEEILPRYDLDDPAQKKLLEERMGPNKAVVICGARAHILNPHLGVFLPGGVWHSNTDYTGDSHHPPEGSCLYARYPHLACGNPGEIPLGRLLICRDCDKAAQKRRALLMEGP